MDEIEKLLSEEEEKDLNKSEDATESDQSADVKAEEKIRKENAILKRELTRRQKEIEALKVPKEEPKVEVKADESNLDTQEKWLAEIDKRAEAKANEKFSALREVSLRKAKDRFLTTHPEYASETGKTKLRSLFERAKVLGLESKVDESEMAECLLDAWAVEHRKELEVVAEDKKKQRERAQKAALSAASTGGSSEKVEDDFTEEERSSAEKFGLTPERYREAEKRLADSNYSF